MSNSVQVNEKGTLPLRDSLCQFYWLLQAASSVTAQNYSKNASNAVGNASALANQTASDLGQNVSNAVGNAGQAASQTMSELGTNASNAMNNTGESVNATANELGKNASDVGSTILNKTGDVAKKIIGGAETVSVT